MSFLRTKVKWGLEYPHPLKKMEYRHPLKKMYRKNVFSLQSLRCFLSNNIDFCLEETKSKREKRLNIPFQCRAPLLGGPTDLLLSPPHCPVPTLAGGLGNFSGKRKVPTSSTWKQIECFLRRSKIWLHEFLQKSPIKEIDWEEKWVLFDFNK